MTLAHLLTARQGDRSFEDLERDCGGGLSAARLEEMAAGHLDAFPPPESVRALASGLGVSHTDVVLAAARTLGLCVRPPAPIAPHEVSDLLADLSPRQVEAIAEVVVAFAEEGEAEPSSPDDAEGTAVVAGPTPESDQQVADVETLHGR